MLKEKTEKQSVNRLFIQVYTLLSRSFLFTCHIQHVVTIDLKNNFSDSK